MLLNFIIYIVSSACNNVVSFNVFGATVIQLTKVKTLARLLMMHADESSLHKVVIISYNFSTLLDIF